MKELTNTSVSIHRNTIYLRYDHIKHDDLFKSPAYKIWGKVIKFLNSRKFNVKENAYYKERFKILSKNHKIGHNKNGVSLLTEMSSICIEVEFGDFKNLWKDQVQSFWSDKGDSRYTKLDYVSTLKLENEKYRFIEFIKSLGFSIEQSEKGLSQESKIIKKCNDNKHIHGIVTCLDDIKKSITEDSYDYQSNSNDANKKKIICGDLKYFYNWRNDRLSCGRAWHNINNMWWVLHGNQCENLSSSDLFDFNENLPKKKPTSIRKLENLLSDFSKKREWSRCRAIDKTLAKLNKGVA